MDDGCFWDIVFKLWKYLCNLLSSLLRSLSEDVVNFASDAGSDMTLVICLNDFIAEYVGNTNALSGKHSYIEESDNEQFYSPNHQRGEYGLETGGIEHSYMTSHNKWHVGMFYVKKLTLRKHQD